MKRRARVPTVLQMEAVECGAACLAMVLAYYGRMVPLEDLRVACGVSRDGSKASNLLKAAQRFGLKASGYKKESSDLSDLAMPAVVHWNFNHFVVVEGIGRRHVLLNDPASGPRRVTVAEFDESFTGVVLTFTPGPEFKRGGHRSRLMLARRLAHSVPPLLFVLLAGLLLVIPGLLAPTFTRIFVDDVLLKGMTRWVPVLLIAMIATMITSASLLWLQQTYLLRLESKLSLSSASGFFWHVLRLPIRFFTQRYAGELGSRVALNDRVAQMLSGELASTVLSAVLVVFYAVLMLQYDITLTLVAAGTMALQLVTLRFAAHRRADLHRRMQRDQGKLIGAAMGGLQSIETLKATGAESDFFSRFSGHQAGLVEAQQQLKLHSELLSVVPTLLMAVCTALILGIGGLRVMDGRMTMGMLVAFQALMLAFIAPVTSLFEVSNTLQEARSLAERLDDVLHAGVDPQASDRPDPPDAEPPVKLTGWVTLRDVSFGYSPLEPPLIEGLNLTLRPGSRVALVGGSGSGKSTVARLVCGLYPPSAGEILFDDIPRQDLSRRLLTASFAMVDQDVFLFEGSVKDNLSLWDQTVPETDLVQAASDAAMHDEITRRPGAYNSQVDEGGRNFSGGQRQRLEIARALVGNPTILVLDEATSALDATTERIVDDNLRRRGCTCLLIAHRLSTIRDCDEIVVLERGKVVQRGTHDQMKDVPGPYSKLIAVE